MRNQTNLNGFSIATCFREVRPTLVPAKKCSSSDGSTSCSIFSPLGKAYTFPVTIPDPGKILAPTQTPRKHLAPVMEKNVPVPHSYAIGCPPKSLWGGGGRASWQAYNKAVSFHSRKLSMFLECMAAQIWNLFTWAPNRTVTPIFRVRTSKLSYRAHRMVIRKLLTRQTR